MILKRAKRTVLLLLAAGAIYSLPASAAPIGTLNIDSCGGGGVTVTASSIDFVTNCIQAGAGTSFSTSFGNIVPAMVGTISNISDPVPPLTTFFSIDPGGGNVNFSNIVLGPGLANTNCAAAPCSIVAGSPFILVGSVSTTVFLPVSGTVTDGAGSSNFVGQFSANFAGITPATLAAQFLSEGSLSSTTFAGSFTATAVPEPGTMTSLGLALLGIYRLTRRQS